MSRSGFHGDTIARNKKEKEWRKGSPRYKRNQDLILKKNLFNSIYFFGREKFQLIFKWKCFQLTARALNNN